MYILYIYREREREKEREREEFTLHKQMYGKFVCAIFSLVSFVCIKASNCERRKNMLYFTLKALFVNETIKC